MSKQHVLSLGQRDFEELHRVIDAARSDRIRINKQALAALLMDHSWALGRLKGEWREPTERVRLT